MKKSKTLLIPTCSLALLVGLTTLGHFSKNNVQEAKAYSVSSLPTEIKLSDSTSSEIRAYYSDLNSLEDSEKTGTNLLKNLKPILKENQVYYGYDTGGENIWKMYEIIDRDWVKSPKENIDTYDPVTDTITKYTYGNKDKDPYIHALYVNRDVDNQTRAWDDHQQTQWGINREHVWPKSHGFDTAGAGGARGDPMHLWAGNGRVNGTEHNNNFYGYVDLTKSYSDPVKAKGFTNLSGNYVGISKTLKSGTVFEPQDSDKGDIARAIFYMVARYNYLSGRDEDGINTNNPNLELVNNVISTSAYTSSTTTTGKMGVLSDLLEWNRLDPPDTFEIHRNNLLYKNYTNNRNPFIDFPQWADYIWGDGAGVTSANPSSDAINVFSGGEPAASVTLNKSSVALDLHGTYTVSLTATSSNSSTISWTTSDASRASLSSTSSASGSSVTITGLKTGSATITASATISGDVYTANCVVTIVDSSVGVDGFSDTLTKASLGISGNSYTDWSGIPGTNSPAIYAGQSYAQPSYIQIRKTNNDSGIISTTSGGRIKAVSLTWNSNTGADKILYVYGKNSAYTSPTELFNSATYGTKLGEIQKGTNTSITISKDYEYVGVCAKDSTVYLDSITFVWAKYLTSIAATNYKTEFTVGDEFTMGGSVTATYSDSSTTDITEITTFTGYDMNTTGVQTVTCTYTEDGETKTTTYDITVNEAATLPTNGLVENDPLTVAEAISACEITGDTATENSYYTVGIVSQITTAFNSTYGNITFKISDDGSTSSDELTVYRCKYLAGAKFTSADQLLVGMKVKIVGKLMQYNGSTNEYTTGCYVHEFLGYGVEYEGSFTKEYTFSENGYSNEQAVSSIELYNANGDSITGTLDKGTGSNAPKYYNNGTALRMYGGNTLVITSSKANIKTITLTFGKDDGSNEITTNLGTYSNGLWTGTATSVTFTIGGTSGNRRIDTIRVYCYGADDFADDFISDLTCDNTGASAPSTSEWSTLNGKYNLLFTAEKNSLKNADANESGTNIEKAMAKYDYIVHKYGSSTYSNFISRTISSNVTNVYIKEKDNALPIVVISLSSITLLGMVLLYLNKKKRNY